jgi:hypothetical protein
VAEPALLKQDLVRRGSQEIIPRTIEALLATVDDTRLLAASLWCATACRLLSVGPQPPIFCHVVLCGGRAG